MAIELTEKNYESTIRHTQQPIIIKAFATWCGPCQQMEPIFKAIEKEFEDSVTFGLLDVDNARELAIELGITSVPTTIFIKNGDVISKEVGYLSKEDLKSKIEKFLK